MRVEIFIAAGPVSDVYEQLLDAVSVVVALAASDLDPRVTICQEPEAVASATASWQPGRTGVITYNEGYEETY